MICNKSNAKNFFLQGTMIFGTYYKRNAYYKLEAKPSLGYPGADQCHAFNSTIINPDGNTEEKYRRNEDPSMNGDDFALNQGFSLTKQDIYDSTGRYNSQLVPS